MPKRKLPTERDADQPSLAACLGTAVPAQPAGPTANVTGNDHATSSVFMGPANNPTINSNSHNTTTNTTTNNNTTNNYNTTVQRPLRPPPAYRAGAGHCMKQWLDMIPKDPRPEHTVEWAEYKEAAQEVQRVEEGEDAYTALGSALAGRDGGVRGGIAQRVVRRWDEVNSGYETKGGDADGKNVNGAKLGDASTKEDYHRRVSTDDEWERVEVKNARASYVPSTSLWKAQWVDIKEENHDVLMRVLETPKGFEVYLHGGKKIGTHGKHTEKCGGEITVGGARGTTDLEEALDQIRRKLVDPEGKEKCKLLGTVSFDDGAYAECYALTKGERAYEGVPLATLQFESRGKVLEELCRLVGTDKFGWETSKAKRGERSNGTANGENTTPYDWATRDADPEKPPRRVEHKAAALIWNTSIKRWDVHFDAVKPALHDDLFLSLYTPRGVHIFRHDGRATISGEAQEHPRGNAIHFTAPVEKHPREDAKTSAAIAEKYLIKKLARWYGLPYLAFVKF